MRWSSVFRRFGSFAALRVASQILAFVTGILVVRFLSTENYAYYALASSLLSAIAVLSASGVSSRLISIVSKVDRPSDVADRAFASALSVRTRNLIVVSALGLPFLGFLLIANGADFTMAIIIVAIVGVATVPAMNIGVYTVELEVGRRFNTIALADVTATGSRLVLTLVVALANFLWAPVLLAVSLIGSLIQSIFVRRAARKTINSSTAVTRQDRSLFVAAVRQTLPASLLMILGEQSVNFLLTVGGNLDGIAQNAALSRFAVAFTVVNSILGTLGASWISRASSKSDLRSVALRYLAAYGSICALFCLLVVAFADQLLFILGSEYEHLRLELIIITVGAALSNFASFGLGVVNHARGWLSYSWAYAPFVATWFVVVILFVDIGSPVGAAVLLASLSLPLVAANVVRGLVGYRRSDG